MFDGQYTIYVVAAFASTGLILAGLIWVTAAASRKAKRDLETLEAARSGTRGSAAAPADAIAGEAS